MYAAWSFFSPAAPSAVTAGRPYLCLCLISGTHQAHIRRLSTHVRRPSRNSMLSYACVMTSIYNYIISIYLQKPAHHCPRDSAEYRASACNNHQMPGGCANGSIKLCWDPHPLIRHALRVHALSAHSCLGKHMIEMRAM
jgi:hypothetical protein